jgi:3-oxoacyl-[acyl-carrier-protein] synthase III
VWGAMRVWISGTGRAVPKRCLETSEIERGLDLAAGSLSQASGVLRRYVCDEEDQISLAVAASQGALDAAGLQAGQIEALIFGAAVGYQPIPSTAPLVMRRLGMADGSAAAFDVNSTCLSFVTGFEVAARLIAGGGAAQALVVSAEVASRALPWKSAPETAALFGDGAAAAVLSAGGGPKDSARVAASLLRSYPSGYEACSIGAGGTRLDFNQDPQGFAAHSLFAMEGKALFRLAALHFKPFVAELLDRAGWRLGDVDLVIPHQASPAALAHLVHQTGFAVDRVVNIAADFGNQVAASIPFALDIARRAGRLRAGDKVLMLGTSAGVSFGGIALEV